MFFRMLNISLVNQKIEALLNSDDTIVEPKVEHISTLHFEPEDFDRKMIYFYAFYHSDI